VTAEKPANATSTMLANVLALIDSMLGSMPKIQEGQALRGLLAKTLCEDATCYVRLARSILDLLADEEGTRSHVGTPKPHVGQMREPAAVLQSALKDALETTAMALVVAERRRANRLADVNKTMWSVLDRIASARWTDVPLRTDVLQWAKKLAADAGWSAHLDEASATGLDGAERELDRLCPRPTEAAKINKLEQADPANPWVIAVRLLYGSDGCAR